MKLLYPFLFLSNFLAGQVWIKLPDFPDEARDDGIAVTVNNTAYFGSGLKVGWAPTIDFHALDLSSFTWSSLPLMPHSTERQYACSFPGPNCFFIFGGTGVGGALNNMYKYDIAASTWTPVASKPGQGLIGANCLQFGDKIVIVGGKYNSGQTNDEVWEYTISSDTWVQKSNFVYGGRWRASSAVLNNIGYLMFGIDNSGFYRKEMYAYAISTDTWSKVMDFPASPGRAYAALQATNNRLILFGGQDTTSKFYKDTWFYNPATVTWLPGPDLPATARRGDMSCTSGDKFFYSCGLGVGDIRLKETWMIDVPLSAMDLESEKSFHVYPNPVKEELTIRTCFPARLKDYDFTLCDLNGKALKVASYDHVLNISDLQQGIYFLKMTDKTGSVLYSRKIFKID